MLCGEIGKRTCSCVPSEVWKTPENTPSFSRAEDLALDQSSTTRLFLVILFVTRLILKITATTTAHNYRMRLMPQIGSWSTVARGCQHTSPLGGAHEGQATRSPPQSLNLLPCCPVLPSLSPEPNSCPPRLFSQGLNYPTPHPLLCPFTLVLSRLLSLPSLPHNLQPLISLDKRPRPHPHSRVKLLFCPL